MKLHKLTTEQARFIWMRSGAVYTLQDTFRYTNLPTVYTSTDYIDGVPAHAERRVINQFNKRADYPAS